MQLDSWKELEGPLTLLVQIEVCTPLSGHAIGYTGFFTYVRNIIIWIVSAFLENSQKSSADKYAISFGTENNIASASELVYC